MKIISITVWRRRTVCCISLFMFSVSCVLKAINDYSTLVISSIMASCSSLLVFSSSQAWYNHEHIENHDFPIEWISETLDKVGFWSGVLSVIAGVIAYFLAEIIVSSPSGNNSNHYDSSSANFALQSNLQDTIIWIWKKLHLLHRYHFLYWLCVWHGQTGMKIKVRLVEWNSQKVVSMDFEKSSKIVQHYFVVWLKHFLRPSFQFLSFYGERGSKWF